MKKGSYIVISFLQIVLVIGAYMVQDFTLKRMGMMRHVMFTNQEWEKKYPLGTLKFILIGILLIVLIGLIYKALKNHSKSYIDIETVVVTLFVGLFITLNSVESILSFYFVSLILVVLIISQYIKYLLGTRNK